MKYIFKNDVMCGNFFTEATNYFGPLIWTPQIHRRLCMYVYVSFSETEITNDSVPFVLGRQMILSKADCWGWNISWAMYSSSSLSDVVCNGNPIQSRMNSL